MTPNLPELNKLDRFCRAGCVVVGSVGVAVLSGWALNEPVLTSIAPGLASMKANTASLFILACTALWLLHTAKVESSAYRWARALSLVLTGFAAVTLAQDIFGRDFGIDQFVFRDIYTRAHAGSPGRMSPVTSLCFLVVGIALLGLKSSHKRIAAAAHWISFLVLFLSVLGILGYLYGVSSLYQVKPFSSMALHTAIAFFVLTLSIKAADPFHGIVNIAASHTAGGIVCRRLLPTIVPLLVGLGWLCLKGQDAGLYDTRFGLALMVSISLTVCVIAIVSTAYALRKIDLTRERVAGEVIDLNANLEGLLGERVEQVAQLTAALAANGVLEQQSLQDGLTKIANRRLLDTYLAGQIAIALRHKRTLAFVLCDVDAFKAFNDQYGHQAGDACLKAIAAAIRLCCHRPADMAARYGGEEFALILPDTDLAGAGRIAETCRLAVAALNIPHAFSSTGPQVSISGGVAILDGKNPISMEQLINEADKSLYRAKREGRNRMVSAQAA